MRWVLGLVGTGIDGPSISVNIMEFDRPNFLEDVANLGLTLTEGKQPLALVQQEVVAAQEVEALSSRPMMASSPRILGYQPGPITLPRAQSHAG